MIDEVVKDNGGKKSMVGSYSKMRSSINQLKDQEKLRNTMKNEN